MHLHDGSRIERLRDGYEEHLIYVAPILAGLPAEAERMARKLFAQASEQTPVAARPMGQWGVSGRWCRRRR